MLKKFARIEFWFERIQSELMFPKILKSWSANFVIETALFEDIIFFSMLMLTLKGISQMKKVTFFINLAQNFILAKLSAKLAWADNFLLKMLDITHEVILKCTNGFLQKWQKSKDRKAQKYF